MKPFLIFLFLFSISFSLYPQDQHTYGPVREQNWGTYWLLPKSSPEGGNHYIGVNLGPPEVKYICFVNWQWTNQDIPSGAELTSIDIAFKALSETYAQRNLQFTFHWIESNWENIDINYYTTQVTNNDDRKVFEDNVESSTNGYATYTAAVTDANFLAKIQTAITNSDDYMTLAIRSEDASAPWWKIFPIDNGSSGSSSIDITFHYTTQLQNFTFYNKFGNNESYGDLVLNNDYQHPFPSGTTKHPSGDSNSVRTDELPFDYNWNQTGTTQKHLFWSQYGELDTYILNKDFRANSPDPVTMKANFNATAQVNIVNNIEGMISGSGNVKFVDPFYYYEDNHIWYQSNEPKTYSSPFTTNNNSETSYGGVFLDQDPNFFPHIPNYSVEAISPQIISLGGDIGIKDFYFLNWSASPSSGASFQNSSAATSGVVFKSDNTSINANLKGQGLSNDPNAYSSNNQKKLVRTDEGYLHNVYESMGHVWYELSQDNGETWTIQNQHQPLDIGGGENPSITDVCINGSHNYVVIVYQQTEEGTGFPYSIRAAVFGGVDTYILRQTELIYSSGYQYTHNEATPVIAGYPAVDCAGIDIVWHTNSGLKCQQAGLVLDINEPFHTVGDPITITGTNSASINPSLATYRLNNPGHYYLVWEENNSIKYTSLYGAESGSVQTISGNDGYAYNTNPSHIVFDDAYSRVCWKGSRYVPLIEETAKITASNLETRVIFRSINSNRFQAFGQNVSVPSISKADNQNYYAVLWSQDENSTYYYDNSYGVPRHLGIPGSNVQISNGSDKDHMYAEVFNTSSQPHYFKTSKAIGSYYSSQKLTGYSFAGGREGVIASDTAQFYFTLGDISVGNQSVGFIEIPDSIVFNSREVLNQYLVSEPFQLTDNSPFFYSIQYGITDSSAAAELLNHSDKFVSFKLQLLDNQTSEVLGTFDEVTYDQSNIYKYSSLSYEVSTEGIGNREVYLRLIMDDNFDADYSLGEIYSAGDVLQKTRHKTANFEGITAIKSYDLSQNYPNPFNPTTTINYQLPQTGFVTLKIYDILGKEVATIVNEQKNQGRYSLQFDASKLSSGVYIYQLHVNDFLSSRKMLLIK